MVKQTVGDNIISAPNEVAQRMEIERLKIENASRLFIATHGEVVRLFVIYLFSQLKQTK